jgi:hypothetical protein
MRMAGGSSRTRNWRLWFCLFALLALVSCSVKLMSSYDETTDRSLSDLQKSVDGFLVTLARSPQPPGCSYQHHQQFYIDTAVAVSSLEVRNRARANNEITTQQLTLLDSSLQTLEQLHRGKGDNKCLSPEEIEPLRRNFDSSFTALLKLEFEKKRGE